MDNMGYLFAAFAVAWAGVFGYIFFLIQKQKRLQRDIDWLKENIKEKD